MDGIELAVRFSYVVNKLRYCGPAEAHKSFLNYLKKKDNPEKIKELLTKFEGLNPYLEQIAKVNKRNPFDYDVVEAYWIGNDLLSNMKKSDLEDILKKLMQRGLPNSIGEKLIMNLPEHAVPHHSFNVFYVGVGQTSGKVKPTVDKMNECMVSWGLVKEITKKHLVVERRLVKFDKKYLFESPKITNANYIKEMMPGVEVGDYVALHWNFASLILDKNQVSCLEAYTSRILSAVNSSEFFYESK